MREAFAIAVIAGLAMPAAPANAENDLLSTADRKIYSAAFKAANKKQWARARRLGAKANDKLLGKVIFWMEATRRGAGFNFKQSARFIEDNPDWPRQELLRRRAEEAIRSSTPVEDVLAWFSKYAPITTDGKIMLGRALMRTGLRDEGIEVVRDVWVNGSFGHKQERNFLASYRRELRREDHMARLDRLLWNGQRHQARRMLPLVSPEYRAVAKARIRLRRRRQSVSDALKRVPEKYRSDPGLLFESMRWNRRRAKVDGALAILEAPPPNLVRPDLWWRDREIVARRVLERGEPERAYRIVRDHRLAYGPKFAEAEWLAGWIALNFLNRPKLALKHFEHLYKVVAFPISLARGAYWSGRAEEALGNMLGAREWYKKATEFDLTYYGQLAVARLGVEAIPATLLSTLKPTAAQIARFNAHELVQVVLYLNELGQDRYLQPFFDRIGEIFKEPEFQVLAGRLAAYLRRPDLAVRIARKAYRRGDPLTMIAYPVIRVPEGDPEQAMLLSIARQESNFKIRARSRAGARGLMQLMPATARAMARRTRTRYSRSRLTSDPTYNLKLGRAYLKWLLRKYDGSYILAVAGYNAGPVAVDRWVREQGDPRTTERDPVDWVELIPYKETRNYVQRVMESLHIYRQRLTEAQVAYTLHRDLVR